MILGLMKKKTSELAKYHVKIIFKISSQTFNLLVKIFISISTYKFFKILIFLSEYILFFF